MIEADSPDDAVRKILKSRPLTAEVHDKLALVTRLIAPMSRETVYAALQPLLVVFGPPDHGTGPEAQAMNRFWLDTYTKAFRNLPREALVFAVDSVLEKGKTYKFPAPADLVKAGEPKANELRKMVWRMKRAAEAAPSKRPKALSEAEREEARAKIAAATAQLGQRGMPVVSAARLQAQQDQADRLRNLADRP